MSLVTVGNVPDFQAAYYGAGNQIWLNQQANAGAWAAQATANDTAWRDYSAAQRADWLEVYYGIGGVGPYDEDVDGSGGLYGDARREQATWQRNQLIIAGLQQVAALYFADKQYDAAKEAQDHQISVWNTERVWAGRLHDLWNDTYRPVEISLLDEYTNQAEFVPDYDAVESRSVVRVREEFALARDKVGDCIDPRCIGQSCDTLKDLAIQEARTAVASRTQAYRAEEARADIKDAQRKEGIFAFLQLGRGLVGQALSALNSAASAANVAAGYNPYEGYASAIGGAAGYWEQYAANRAASAGATGSSITGSGSTFGLNTSPQHLSSGYTGNTNNYGSFGNAPSITGFADLPPSYAQTPTVGSFSDTNPDQLYVKQEF